jgi:hypothetical protein
VDWIRLSQYKDRWLGVVSAVMKLRVLAHGVSYGVLMKGTVRRSKLHAGEKLLLYRVMTAGAYVREHPEMIQRAVHCCLERARMCIENHAYVPNGYKMYAIIRSNKLF